MVNRTQIPSSLVGDGTIGRPDLDVTKAGTAVIAKALSAGGITQTFTGPVAGTGDVIFSLGQFNERTPGASGATLLNTDGIVLMPFSGANQLTIQTSANGAYPAAMVVNVIQTGVGKTQIVAASGVTFINPGSLYLRTKGSALTCKRLGTTDTWVVTGDTDDVVAATSAAKAFFKGTRNALYSVPQAFGTIPIDTVVANTGGGAFNTSTFIYTIPVTGLYDCTANIRIVDSSAPYNVGIGVGTSNADSPDFYWHTNASPSQGTPRETFQYSNRFSFSSGDQVRLFAYVDVGNGVTFTTGALAITQIG